MVGVGTPAAFIEQSRLVVETVTKTTSQSIFNYSSDSSKVVVTGNGLNQIYVNQEASLLVDGSQAGEEGILTKYISKSNHHYYNGLFRNIQNLLLPFFELLMRALSLMLMKLTGYNMLWVGVAGPHIPVDKIFVTHLGNLRYSVKYQVNICVKFLVI